MNGPTAATADTEGADPAVPPLGAGRALTYSAGSIGAGAFFAFNNFVLPQLLKAAGAGDLLTGLLSSTRSLEGAVIQPAIGALSDRTRTRLGRRRPFIAAAIPLSAGCFLFAAGQRDIAGLAVGIVLFSIFFNIAADPYVALLADITRRADRSLLSGLANGIQLLSQVAFLLAISLTVGGGGIPGWSYAAVAALLVLTFGLTVLGVREPAAPPPASDERRGRQRCPRRDRRAARPPRGRCAISPRSSPSWSGSARCCPTSPCSSSPTSTRASRRPCSSPPQRSW